MGKFNGAKGTTSSASGATAAPESGLRPSLLAELVGARIYEDVVIPRTSVRGKMRLLSRTEISRVRADARAALLERGLPLGPTDLASPGVLEEWNAELQVRVLHMAVRDPQSIDDEVGTLPEWQECDDDQIGTLYVRYKDLADRLDPLRDGGPGLTETDLAELDDAAKKKDVDRLMSCGSRKLALFATTSAERPAS